MWTQKVWTTHSQFLPPDSVNPPSPLSQHQPRTPLTPHASPPPPPHSRYENSVNLNWGVAGPGTPVPSSWWISRFTFYISVSQSVREGEGGGGASSWWISRYTFYISVSQSVRGNIRSQAPIK